MTAEEVTVNSEENAKTEVLLSEAAETACQINEDDVLAEDSAQPTADSFSPGTWYKDANCKAMMDWCIANNKPFFAFYTNVSGGCSYCEKWDSAVINNATFKTYMASSNLYYGYYEGTGKYSVIDKYISTYCGGDVGGFPFGFFYKNSTFNEYFERPGQQKTKSKYRTGSSIATATGMVNLCKEYEFTVVPTYTVTFKDWDGTVLKTQTVESGSSATPPSNPTRSGYTFTGWQPGYTSIVADTTCVAQYVSDGTDQKKKIINSYCLGLKHDCTIITKDNVTLYYVYSLNQILRSLAIKIKFSGNGSTSGSVADIDAEIGKTWTCPACTYARTDYEFDECWTDQSDGSGNKYYPGTTYSTPASQLTLYAKWKATVSSGTYVVLAATETSPGCSKLTGMDNDIDRIKAKLPSSIPSSNIIELRNSSCTTANIKKHLEIGKNYELLIYLFSDHGGTSDNGVMCTYDGRFKSADFYSIVSQSKGRVFAIFACCHAEDQYQLVSPYASDEAGNAVSAVSLQQAEEVFEDGALSCDSAISCDPPADETTGQFDWAQGAIDYFNDLKKRQDALKQKIEARKSSGLLMAASNTEEEEALLAANATPNMLCWCACKKSQVSFMTPGKGHYFITGLVNNFNASRSYSTQWDAFANKSPAKGTTSGYTYTPVKAVLGTSFESNTVFT